MNDTSITNSNRDSAASETEITLGVLDAVQANASVTQRSVAQDVGIALGLANAYLKRCVRKGLIKVQQMPPNRYSYYLTAKGISEKARLSAEYLSSSFTFFRRAREQCEAALDEAKNRGWRRVGLVGRGELAEIATLCNTQNLVELVLITDDADPQERHAGVPVQDLDQLDSIDGIILTDLAEPQATYDRLCNGMIDKSRILTPALLRVRTEAEEKASS